MAVWTAVFDLDGTLVDTSGDMLAAANAIFEAEVGARPLRQEAHTGVAFAGGRAMLRTGAEVLGLDWGAAKIDAAYGPFLEAYGADLHRRSVPYPGVAAALARLSTDGWRLAVCTNKPEALAERLMAALDLRAVFGALIGADTLPVRKPDPAPVLEAVRRVGGTPAAAVMIGDSAGDMAAANAAGTAYLHVGFGPGAAIGQAIGAPNQFAGFPDLGTALTSIRAASAG